MNLHLSGCPYALSQTCTKDTEEILAIAKRDRLAAAERYADLYIRSYYPPPLRGKDARNPYLVGERETVIREGENGVGRLKAWLVANPTVQWEGW